MGIKLYKHNQEAYEKLTNKIESLNRVCIIHPTGTGKSYIAFKIAEESPAKAVLWLGPSEYIYRLQVKKIKKSEGITCKNISFKTYHWLSLNEDNIPYLKPDYIILDEFHRAGASEWGKGVLNLLKAYPKAKVIGLTATNVRYLDNQRDMAKELFDNEIASEMDMVEAMARGILPLPTYVIGAYSYENMLKEYNERNKNVKNSKKREKNQELIEKLKRALEQAEGIDGIFAKYIEERTGKYIIFCRDTDAIYEMVAKVPEWFQSIDRLPHVYMVHTYNPESEKEFRDFQEDDSEHIKLLFAVDMLNEGIHIDDVDGVILLRPTISPIVYRQQIGRALSTGSKKKPIVFDLVNNFDNMYSVKKLEEDFEQKREYLRSIGEYVTFEDFKISDEVKDCRMLMEQIRKNLGNPWQEFYDAVCEYKEKQGDIFIPYDYVTEEGLYIGKWLQAQRLKQRQGILDEERCRLLEELGVDFRSILDVKREKYIRLCIKFKEKHGHMAIPGEYVTEDGWRLGNWASNMRNRINSGAEKDEAMIKRLKDMGFVWSLSEYDWETRFQEVKEYYDIYGDLTMDHIPDRVKRTQLRHWLTTQRSVYTGRCGGRLDEDRIRRLNELGIIWSKEKHNDDIFAEHCEEYRAYIKAYGNTAVKQDYVTKDGVKLASWISNQRDKNRNGKLSAERIHLLEEAGMIWEPTKALWHDMYEKTKAYVEKYGDVKGLSSHNLDKEKSQIKEWIRRQRDNYNHPEKKRNRALTEEEKRKIEALGIL